MNRIDRLFGISTLLQSRKFTPAEKLTERFDISIRTVYRDIRALIEQGIPIGFESGKGYFVVEGYFMPPVSFNTNEVNALLLAEQLASGFGDKSIATHYTSALNKVRAVLKPKQLEKLEQLNAHIKFQIPARMQYAFEYLSVLQEAISEKMQLRITYKNLKEEHSDRTIECIGLVYYAFNWHAICWCLLRKEYRDFNVARIISIHPTSQPFIKNDHIEIGDYLKELPVNY